MCGWVCLFMKRRCWDAGRGGGQQAYASGGRPCNQKGSAPPVSAVGVGGCGCALGGQVLHLVELAPSPDEESSDGSGGDWGLAAELRQCAGRLGSAPFAALLRHGVELTALSGRDVPSVTINRGTVRPAAPGNPPQIAHWRRADVNQMIRAYPRGTLWCLPVPAQVPADQRRRERTIFLQLFEQVGPLPKVR